MKSTFKFALVLFAMFISLNIFAQEFNKNYIIHADLQYNNWADNDRLFPQIGVEYKFSKFSAIEFKMSHHNNDERALNLTIVPISLGYKFSVMPLFSKDMEVRRKVNLYTSIRYVYLHISNAKNIEDSNEFVIAPGLDFYLTDHWGLNAELNFSGNSYLDMVSFGVCYRF